MKKYQKTNFSFLIENIEARRSIMIEVANSQCFFLAGRPSVGQSLVNAIKIQRRKNKKQKKNKKKID